MRVSKIDEVRSQVKAWKKAGATVGYVPTMGALHEGHISLMERARQENDYVIVSIFVNPTQFGAGEDFAAYPRNQERDCMLCEQAGVQMVFCPTAEEMYLPDKSTTVGVGGISEVLCGETRPRHFDGVCLVVAKFFNIIAPDRAYFGQKDAQQIAVVRKMVRDLNMDVEIVACPIVRETDGLAKSSRNVYLSQKERSAARIVSQALYAVRGMLEKGERNAAVLRDTLMRYICKEPLARLDYAEIVDNESLTAIEGEIRSTVLIPVAVYIGKTRLIDNIVYEI